MSDNDRPILSAAHTPLVLLGALLILTVIIGLASGTINHKMFVQAVPSPNDPITLP